MKYLFLIILAVLNIRSFSQCITFSYDLAGNRTARSTCPQPLAAPGNIFTEEKNMIDLNGNNISDLKVFPNPVKVIIQISSSQLSSKSKLQIVNILGQKMYDGVLGDNQINMSSWQSGRYFLRVQEGDKVKVVTILKE